MDKVIKKPAGATTSFNRKKKCPSKLTKIKNMANQNSELRNPLFWALIVFLVGGGLLIWGAIKGDCSGPDCWVGSGFLKWTGVILLAAGALGFFTLGNRK